MWLPIFKPIKQNICMYLLETISHMLLLGEGRVHFHFFAKVSLLCQNLPSKQLIQVTTNPLGGYNSKVIPKTLSAKVDEVDNDDDEGCHLL